MSDPTLSEIDFKNKMAWVGTTLNWKDQIWSVDSLFHPRPNPNVHDIKMDF